MDRHQVRFALLKITLLVLLGTSWVFWSFVYATRPAMAESNKNALDALIRLPASLPAQLKLTPTTKTLQPIEMNVTQLACWDSKDIAPKNTPARWVRLTGRPCQMSDDPEKVTVRNLSNGYVATVFAAQPGALTTDFIPLQMGKNDILIRFESAPGASVESQFTFLRR